jgi:hypothetical protein
MTFGYMWTLYVRVCGINDSEHTCDEYLVLVAKPGTTVGNLDVMIENFTSKYNKSQNAYNLN